MIVAQVLIADGVLGDREREHLDQVMASLGMDEAEQSAALKGVNMDSPVEERVKALSDEAKAGLLEAVQKAAATDETEDGNNLLVDRIRALIES